MNAQLNEAADRRLRTSGRSLQTEVCIIGAGAMGLCTATLLAQAGVQCVVVERNEIGSGATSNNAGVLHSGARYAVADPSMAGQCLRASDRLARFARHAITNENPAYYLIVDDATEEYAARFLHSCSHLGIPCEVVDRAKVCHEEPILDETRIRGAISVPDRVFDPFALLASYEQFLQDAGTRIYPKTQVSNAVYEGSSWKMGGGVPLSVEGW